MLAAVRAWVDRARASVLVESLWFALHLALITALYYAAPLRTGLVRVCTWIWSPGALPPSAKRIMLVALYLDVPIVRRACGQWGIARVFPGFLNEMASGALKTTSFSMQVASSHSPFCFVPSLGPRGPFLDELRPRMGFLKDFEAATATIAAEMQSCNQKGDFTTFFGSWMTYDFYLYGRFDAARAAACATTFALLRSVPGLVRNSQCGFSRLAAEDRIGAHSDAHATNLRCRVHVPLVCIGDVNVQRFRVGDSVRMWECGHSLIFDTCYQHEAINTAEEDRMVLLYDVWHPQLGAADLKALQRLDSVFDH